MTWSQQVADAGKTDRKVGDVVNQSRGEIQGGESRGKSRGKSKGNSRGKPRGKSRLEKPRTGWRSPGGSTGVSPGEEQAG